MTGYTTSQDFPTTSGAFRRTPPGGSTDSYVAKLNASGSSLVYSTYLGGSGDDGASSIAVDGTGNAYVTLRTASSDFPTTTGAYSTTYGGGAFDVAVSKLNASSSALVYSTFVGGNGLDQPQGLALDSGGNAYVAGFTTSPNFPLAKPIQGTYTDNGPYGQGDGFVFKLNASGNALTYSTYLGGSGDTNGYGIAVDSAGEAYVTGETDSTDFPTANAFQLNDADPSNCASIQTCGDAFLSKFTAAGTALAYSTYLGGYGEDEGGSVALDGAGNAYIMGYTNSTNFPTVNAPQPADAGSYDAFAVKVVAASSGAIPWRPHHTVRLSDGLSASVDLADGHVDVTAAGLRVPARGPDLALDQVWDSALAQAGVTSTLGQGWVSSLTPRMSGILTGTVRYQAADGAIWPFQYTGPLTATGLYTYTTPPGLPWQLTASTSGYTLTNILTSETLSFDALGRLVSDADAYNNQNTLSYTGTAPLPVIVANSGGQGNGTNRALHLGYNGAGQLTYAQSPLAYASANQQGQLVGYAYNGAGELSVLIRGYGTSDAVTETFGYSGTQLTTITTGAGHVWALSYDTQGRVVGITSPASGTVGQAGYTPSYSTIFVYNPSQTTVAEGYNTPGQLLTTYTLDSQGEAIAVTDGLNDTSYTTYDADHDVLTSTDANNHTTRNYLEYVGPNGSTGLITETDRPAISPLFQGNTLAPVTTTYKYDTANNLIEQDTSYGSVTGYTYDSHHGQLSRVEYVSPVSSCSLKDRGGSAGRHPDNGCSTTYEWRGQINAYDTYGELVARTDGRGVSVAATNAPSPPPTPTLGACPNRCAASYTQSYTYTVQGDLASESTPPIVTTLNGSTVTAPVTTSYGYDGDGNQISQTSANGKTTTYSYDHLGRQTQVSNPSVQIYTGSTITPTETTQYDKDGNVAQEVDGNGDVSQSSYDPLDRLVAATNAISGTTIYTYSATEKTAQQDPQGNVTTYGYDAAGRLLSTTDPAHDVTQYQYDPVGNTVTITTGDGTTATSIDTRQYDALDEIVTDTVSGPGSPTQRTVTSYDQNGNVVQVQQPDGDVVFNSYDFANQLIASEIDAGPVTGQTNNLQELFSYDDAGNVVSRQDFDNRSAVTTYDGDNRVAQTVDTDLTSGTVITTTSGYDPDGNTISQQTQTALAGGAVQTHSETDAYNAADWLTGTTVDGTTTSYDYDGAGQERSQTVNNNANHVRSTLNPEGLTTQIVEAVGGSTTYTDTFGYNADDLPLTQSVPGPVTEQVSYDMASRPITVTWSGPAGVSAPLASSYSYGYNAASWTTALTSTLNGNTTTQTLTHDAAGRLTAAQGPGSASQSWTYDGNGNILTHTVGSATSVYSYTTALPNELLQLRVAGQPTSYYSYDHNGDTTNITNGSTLNTSLQYDSQARLITITQADGTQVTLGYNDAGQRSSYRVSKGGSTSLAETFQYRDGLVGQAVVVTGTTTYTDTYLYTQDGAPLELVRIQSGQPVKRYWYVLDGRDNVVALTDSSGNVVDRYSYDVWGNPTSVSESVVQPFRYAGYWWDAQLGWYWVSVRYYDPSLERWVQPDPSQIEGVHTYTYVHDDPINNVDPSGMCSIGPVNLPVGRSEPCINDIVRELHGHMPYGRWPDYLVLTGAIGKIFQIGPIPLPSTFGVNVVLSRYGHWYWGVAGGLGTPGSSIFIGAGWIFQGNVPSDSYLESFITGWSISGNVVTSAHAGGTIVWGEVPDAGHWSDFGFELGAGSSTGASITASYDWPIPLLPQGPSWSH